MSSTFTPDPGTLFYAECTITYVRGGDPISMLLTGVATKPYIERDRSYSNAIFRAIASDERSVIATIVHGSFKNEQRMLLRTSYAFHPVGPNVAAAMGLDMSEL